MKLPEEILFLTVEDVVFLHARGIDLYGGAHGTRDLGLVESAALAAQQTFGGQFLCTTLEEIAATYWYNLANNHGFIDGNKRVALRAADVFLARNGFDLELQPDKAAEVTEGVASGKISKGELIEIVRRSIRPL
ncbi:MAG: death on curing protein [Fimbriimonadaceae bacterium]|jgi:death-on-curing protein|nr:death on curing protein [Fimbriimonadaceae bacterium]